MTAALYHDSDQIELTVPTGGFTSGQLLQAPDGRAAVVAGLRSLSAGDPTALEVSGKFTVPKTTGMVFLDGQGVWVDVSTGKVHYKRQNDGDFYGGTVVGDAALNDTTCVLNLNVFPHYDIAMGDGVTEWVSEATLGLGVTVLPGGGVKLEFDAVAEVAQAAFYSSQTVAFNKNPIMEAWLAVYDIGDSSTLDATFGLASTSHASDFQTVANFVAIAFAGGGLSILVESDDGTTDVAPADSLIDAVDDTRFLLQIDCRNPADVQVYINGVDAVPAGTTLALTASTLELRPIAHIEKTSNDTTADFRVLSMGVRSQV